MKAVIMAGGDGKRLRPITCTMPKPMVPLLNRPIIDYSLDLLKKHGITDAVVTVHYLPKLIMEHVGSGEELGLNISYSDPGKKLGTAGSLKYALDSTEEAILVLSGDGITDIELGDLIEKHKSSGADATIVLKCVEEPTEYGVALSNKAGFINRFIEKPEANEIFSDYANTGIYVLEPSAIKLIPDDREFDFSNDLFPLMLEKGMKIYGYKTDKYWCDVGNVSEFRRAQYDMLDEGFEYLTHAERKNGALIEPGALVSPDAKLIFPCYIGKNAVISAGAELGPDTVVCSGAIIGENASIKRSILLPNCIIRSNCELREVVVCENAEIDRETSMYSESVVGAGTYIGPHSHIYPNAMIWPEKKIEGNSECYDNVIWGGGRKEICFSNGCITGHADSSFTPETAARIGAAIALQFKANDELAISCDGNPASVMIKAAITAGINSQGIDTALFYPQSINQLMYDVENGGYDGGVYIELCSGRMLCVTILDKSGSAILGSVQRKIKRDFETGEHRATVLSELGIQMNVSGRDRAYEKHLAGFVETGKMICNPCLYLDAPEHTGRVIELVLTKCGWRTVITRSAPTELNELDFYIKLDTSGELKCELPGGLTINELTAKTLIAKKLIEQMKLKEIVLPSTLDDSCRRYLRSTACELSFTKANATVLKRSARSLGIEEEPLYNPEASIILLCDLFGSGTLLKMLQEIPIEYHAEKSIEVQAGDRGRILRALCESEVNNGAAEMIDGYRLSFDTGWVAVRSSDDRQRSFKVAAGSANSEYAEELCDVYLKKLRAFRDRKTEN